MHAQRRSAGESLPDILLVCPLADRFWLSGTGPGWSLPLAWVSRMCRATMTLRRCGVERKSCEILCRSAHALHASPQATFCSQAFNSALESGDAEELKRVMSQSEFDFSLLSTLDKASNASIFTKSWLQYA